MAKAIINLAASVRARLLSLSKATGQTFDLVLTRFALERLLYRLSNSKHAERFALKGAMPLTTWFEDPTRPTRDIDLLGFGDADSEAMLQTFREIIQVDAADGMIRSEEHTSELQSLMRISYAVFCLKKKMKEMKTNTCTTSA